jgi:8-oxo-dGTP diphosphatase
MNHPKHIVTAAALITRKDGMVVILKNARGEWEFPGGQVEEGETIIQGLLREIEEETGVQVEVGQLVGIYSRLSQPQTVNFTFLCDWISGELRISEESVEVIWEQKDNALAKITKPQLYARMKDMLNFKGDVIYQAFDTQPYKIYENRVI